MVFTTVLYESTYLLVNARMFWETSIIFLLVIITKSEANYTCYVCIDCHEPRRLSKRESKSGCPWCLVSFWNIPTCSFSL
ncbi:hypothetical protein P879_04376 [Paragonimus westermani]|uniref:Uncharacterized protein n=1 Tax=Paragonimus westermani TaxID=34504 RepID=A0A8T0DP73_9TREM|nr:hypothetical protein P879_04376 [Paragonimus westermani]